MLCVSLATPGTEACDAVGGALRPKWREWPSRAIRRVLPERVAFGMLPAALFALLPTCPLCRNFAAYTSSIPSRRNGARFRTAHFSADRRTEVCQLVQPSDHSLCVSSIRAILVRGLKVRQSSAASIASGYYDRRTRSRNIFILRCGTKDHVLLVPQSRQWINSGRSPCRRIASENRGA